MPSVTGVGGAAVAAALEFATAGAAESAPLWALSTAVAGSAG